MKKISVIKVIINIEEKHFEQDILRLEEDPHIRMNPIKRFKDDMLFLSLLNRKVKRLPNLGI